METQIVPCRAEISDRFPVASFAVNVPPTRCFEVACATDPRLFHTDWQRHRSPRNFYSSRSAGLMRAPGGHTAWFIPPEQLRRFAGAQRIYYALATYDPAYGGAPEFTISPATLDRAPSIALAGDFTGRGLDRSRLGVTEPVNDRYGAVDPSTLTWGGDEALAAERSAGTQRGAEYDDGYPKDLWQDGDAPAAEHPTASQAGLDDPSPDHAAYHDEDDLSVGAALGDDDSPAAGDGSPYDYPSAAGAAYESDEYPQDAPADGYGAVHDDADDDEDDAYGGFRDAAELYGAGGPVDDDVSDDGAEHTISSGAAYDDGTDEAPADGGYSAAAAYDGDDDGAPYDGGGYGGSAYDDSGDGGSPYDGDGYGGAPHVEVAHEGSPYDDAVYGGGSGYDSGDDGGVAVAEPPPATAESAGVTGRDPAYSEEEPEEQPLPVGRAAHALGIVALDIPEKVRILRVVALAESGRDAYTAINPDNEFSDPHHPAHGRYHIGLSWGFIQFTQRSGALGKVLRAVKRREDALGAALPAEQRFAQLFGPSWEELLRVTNAADPDARVAPVGGKVLWDPEWTARFRAAGRVPHVTYAQNEVAITEYVDPNLRFAAWLGFDDARALAMLWDRCIHMGNGGGTTWIMGACGPIHTDEERAAALAALGHADLRAFQQSQAPHLGVDGKWGPRTHAALVHALRSLGARSPVAIPSRDALLQTLVDVSAATRFHARLSALHANRTDFDDDTLYVLA